MKKYTIGRNEKCFCGSDIKFKNCCMRKKDLLERESIDAESFKKLYSKGRKQARFRECHHPVKNECSEKIISAHSIQNNKILSKIADDGVVLMPIPKNSNFNEQTEYGRKEATTFTGFCNEHDKYTFRPIEDQDFEGSEEQVFLHIYRAFVLELHRKEEGHRFSQYLFSMMPSIARNSEKMKQLWVSKIGHDDLLIEKEEFDKAIIDNKYNCLTYFVWEFEGESSFAATGMEEPRFDYSGLRIQNLEDFDIPAKHIYYTIFPDNGKMYFIIAWLKSNDELFCTIGEKLGSINEEEKKNFVNNVVPSTTENLVINPSSWGAMKRKEKENFNSNFQGKEVMLELLGKLVDRFSYPGYDLFKL